MSLLPKSPLRYQKHCFIYCGPEYCDCQNANDTYYSALDIALKADTLWIKRVSELEQNSLEEVRRVFFAQPKEKRHLSPVPARSTEFVRR